MDGTDMVRALRKRRPGIRVIFMSGYTHGGLEIPEADKQSTRFLAKPFSAEQLVGALVELLQSST
jgi:two-component system cell cycle sensor histidine kinase/response regulator CckA